jgi:hypothetical protein
MIRLLGILIGFSILIASCGSLTTGQPPTGTPRVVIRVGPPVEGGTVPANPFEGTALPPLEGRSPLDPPQQVDLDAPFIEAPMIDNHGLPAVEVEINGSGPYRFVVDWGANIFAMSPQLAVELGLTVLGLDEMGNPNAQVETLSIGAAHFSDLTVVLDPFFSGTQEDGVLGRNVYEALLFTLDYPARRVRLEKGEMPEADGASIFAYTPSEGGAPMLEMDLQGRSFLAVLDTGAARGLIIPASQAGAFSFISGPVPAGEAVGPQLGAAESQVGRLAGDLRFGAYTVTNPVAVILDRPEYLIGSQLLSYFAVTLDQQVRRVRLSRPDPAPIVVPPEPWESAVPGQ